MNTIILTSSLPAMKKIFEQINYINMGDSFK